MPRRLDDQARHAGQGEGEHGLIRCRPRQMQADLALQHLDADSQLDQTQAQRVELRHPPGRPFRHGGAQRPHQPVGAGMQEQPHLIGGRAAAGRAVGGEVGLERLDVVLGLSAGAVDVLVDGAARDTGEAGDDEACIDTLWPGLDSTLGYTF